MKRLIYIIIILLGYNGFSQDYYVSNNGNDKNNGRTESTSWKTLDKVNKEMKKFRSGDVVAFKGGDQFYGRLELKNLRGVTFRSYGTGKAVITGAKSVDGWVNVGGNIWELSTGSDDVYQVFRGDKVLTNGRMPLIGNQATPSKSYYTVTSKSSTKNSFTSKDLKGMNLLGATCHMSSRAWRLQARTITSFNSSTGSVTLSGNTSYTITEGDRFFVNNDASLLTTQDDWYYKGKVLSIYSTSKPTNIVVNTLDKNGVEISSSDDITFENLIISKYDGIGINIKKSRNFTAKKVDLDYCYFKGVYAKSSPNFTFTEGSIVGSNKRGIDIIHKNSTNPIITNNYFDKAGVFENATSKEMDDTMMIYCEGDKGLISGNTMLNSGYIGIRFRGANTIVEKNYIKDICLTLDDGSGIYTHNGDWSSVGATGSVIRNNIVIGFPFEEGWYANGLYTDDRSHDTTWEYNTVIGTNYGIYIHNSARVTFRYNNIYGTSKMGIYLQEDTIAGTGEGYMVNNDVSYNNIFTFNDDLRAYLPIVIRGSWKHYDFGKYNYNNCFNPLSNNSIGLSTSVHNGGAGYKWIEMNLGTWTSKYSKGQDLNSKEDKLKWKSGDVKNKSQIVYNKNNSDKAISLKGIWEDLEGKKYNNSITLKPFTSKILIVSDDQTGAIKANAGEDVTICSEESIKLTANGGSSYEWSTGAKTQSITVSPSETETYTVTATDKNGNKGNDDVVVTVNEVVADAGSDVTIDQGETATLSATGGDSYLWSTGDTTASITVSPDKTTDYTVTVTTAGCEATDGVQVLVNTTGSTTLVVNAGEDVTICSEESVELSASGGSSYEWSTGAKTQSITVNPSETETYTVTATDKNGNKGNDDVVVTVNEVVADAGSDVTIDQGETATLSATGGDSYLWSTGDTTASITVSPDKTTDYTVTVTTAGCEATDGVQVLVNTTGSTTLVANAGEDVTICNEESVELTASGGSSYEWSTGAKTQSIKVSPSETKTYTVTVTDKNGNTGKDDVVVTVNEVVADAGSDVTIDQGETATLSATGGDSYLWSTGDTTASITVSPDKTTDYTVTVTTAGCEATDGVQVLVNTTGSTTLVANAGEDVTICNEESVELTASGGSSYEWSTGAKTQSIKVSPSETKTYTVTVTDKSGNTGKDDVVVTVNEVVADAGSDVTIDQGETATLSATGGDSYLWSTGETTASITVSPDKTTDYSVTVTTAGCEATDGVQVLVNTTGSTTLVVNAGEDVTICSEESVELTASGGSSYEWSTGAKTQSITVNPSETETYTVTATDKNGNKGNDDVVVTVNNVNANAGSDVTIDQGDQVKLTAKGGDSYLWSTGEESKSILVGPTETFKYQVRVITNGCEDMDEVVVNVQPKRYIPKPPVAFAGEDMSICLGETVALQASGGDFYEWSNGENKNTVNVKPSRTTTYTVSVKRGGVTDTDTVTVTVENCNEYADSDIAAKAFVVYPNPSTGRLKINLNEVNNELNLVLINLNGIVVFKDKIESSQRGLTKEIDLSNLVKGYYFVRLFNHDENMVRKVLLI